VPWVLAYTGLRVTEITQFRGRHLREEGGIPHLLITPADGSTKSGNAWAVGIHKHLIELGLLDFIRETGDGPLFYEPYPAGTDLTAIKGKSRALEAGMRVGKWITEEVGIKAPLGRPNHAWRHLFTTRSRACGMDKEARDFMMGSRSGTDAREGYGDWPPAVLDDEINKLPRFSVEDAGWRP
jgi:integrase